PVGAKSLTRSHPPRRNAMGFSPPKPQKQSVEDRLKRLEAEAEEHRKQDEENRKNIQRLKNQSTAKLLLDQFADQVDAQAENWMIAARMLGSAYKTAAEQHKATLGDQAQSDALSDQMMFSVLTVAASGALAWASGMWQLRTANLTANKLAAAKKDLR